MSDNTFCMAATSRALVHISTDSGMPPVTKYIFNFSYKGLKKASGNGSTLSMVFR